MYSFESHSIVFLDLENVYLDTKIMILCALGAKIWEFMVSMAAILNFSDLTVKNSKFCLVTLIFGFSRPKSFRINLLPTFTKKRLNNFTGPPFLKMGPD